MHFHTAFITSALVALVAGQTIETSSAASVAPSSTQSQSMPPQATQGFNPANVTQSTKFQWCLAQLNTCPQICGGAASLNQCDAPTLTYACTCPNGTVPDSSAFQQTLPYYICQETFIQCVANNPDNAEGQSTCRTNNRCGTRNATAEALAATGSASSTTAAATSGSGSATGSASASATSASASAGEASVTTYTAGAFAAVLMAVFKLLL